MTRTRRILFGSFGKLLSAGVFADGWWLFLAFQVELEGDSLVSHELADILPERARKGMHSFPAQIDLEWFRAVAPIGLQARLPVVEDSPFLLGLVAGQVQDKKLAGGAVEDIAYPFLFGERDARLVIQFSSVGPALEVQHQIVAAFGQRLLR